MSVIIYITLFVVMSYFMLSIDFTSVLPGVSSWRVLLLSYMGPTALGLLGLIYLPESPKFLLLQGQCERALEVLQQVYRINTKTTNYSINNVEIDEEDKGYTDVKGFQSILRLMWEQTLQLFERKRIWQTLNMCTIDFIICVIGVGITMWLPTILNYLVALDDENLTICSAIRIATRKENSNDTEIDVCSSPNSLNVSHFKTLIAISAALLGYYVISSAVVNFVGRKRLLVIWFSLGTICAFSMYWINIYFLSILFLTLICQMGKFHGMVVSCAADYYPSSINAMGVSFVTLISSVGLVVGGNITGTLFLNHCDFMFFGCSAGMFFVVILTTLLPNENRK